MENNNKNTSLETANDSQILQAGVSDKLAEILERYPNIKSKVEKLKKNQQQ